MIVTLTPNPSVDRTIEVDELVRGAVLRARHSRVDPGGKGVNVSRALAAHGIKTRAVLPSGGAEGAQLAALLEPQGIEIVPVPISGAVRANVSVVEPDGTVTKLNEPGPELDAGEVQLLVAATRGAAEAGAQWVVCCGSLPRGVPADFYATLLPVLHQAGCRVVVDSSGPALTAALPHRPDLIKPNREELAEAAGQPVDTVGDAVTAARSLVQRGAATVLASLGADGALLIDADGAYHAEAHVATPRSAVGAGDATLAGFLAGGGQGPDALVTAIAWGAAATSLPGSRMPTPQDLDLESVQLQAGVDADRVLKGSA
jgi:1-phosphofructokinase